MIYVTGDVHGNTDIRKFSVKRFPEGRSLTEDDYVIVCGDFGLVWDWSDSDMYWLKWLSEEPWTTLWVDGNHENHDLIDTLPTEELFGGKVQHVPGFPNLIHLMRGEVYDIPDAPGRSVRCFVMGGAASHDRQLRTAGVDWWAREMPSREEYDRARDNLARVGFSVDYVFTHDCPTGVAEYAMLGSWGRVLGDDLQQFLQWVDERLDYERLRRWYFGHYHEDCCCRDSKHVLLYQQVVRLGDEPWGGGRAWAEGHVDDELFKE